MSIPPTETESSAQYSYVVLRTENWDQMKFVDKDGQQYEVQGYVEDENGQVRCPTEKCQALCCQAMPLIGPVGTSCEHLNQDTLKCGQQEKGGRSCKPISCVVWPRRQLDIDTLNDLYAQGEKRCYLKVVKVEDHG